MELYYKLGDKYHNHGNWNRFPMNTDYIDSPVDECECDLHMVIKETGSKYVAKRYNGGVKKTVDDMMYQLCTMVMSQWRIEDHKLVPNEGQVSEDDLELRIRELRGDNVMPIRNYFYTHRSLQTSKLVVDNQISMYYQAFDLYYLGRFVRIDRDYMEKNVWQCMRDNGKTIQGFGGFVGIPWENDRVRTLTNLCLIQLSIYNGTFGGYSNGMRRTVYTMDNIRNKVYPTILKIKKPTHTMYGKGKFIAQYTYKVLDIMVDLLDVRRFKKMFTWDFETELAHSANMPRDSSAGIRAGKDRIETYKGVTIHIKVNGKKKHQMEYTEDQIRNLYESFQKTGKCKLVNRAWIIVLKAETLAGTDYAEIVKNNSKARDFNIPTAELSRAQRMVHHRRQNIERGHHIAIGMTFWHGGSKRIALKLHCHDDRYIFSTADFVGLDKIIKAHFLKLYSGFSAYYYRTDTKDYDFFLEFLKMVSDNLAFKIVHVYKDVWKAVFGGMPSGAYETSHGDSWIVMYIMIMFIVHQAEKHPSMYYDIIDALYTGRIWFFIYGDDNIWSMEKKFKDIIGIWKFKEFVEYYFQMELRDIEETTNFFTLINDHTGMATQKGCVFLSRYFIKREQVTDRKDVAEILPYREFIKTYKKYAFGDGSPRTPVDYVLASIGMAYDSFGTNTQSYRFCYMMFNENMKRLGCSDWKDFVRLHPDSFKGRNVLGLMKKAGMDQKMLSKGFPSRDRLMDMHRYDESKHIMRDEGEDEFLYFDLRGTDIIL